MIRSEHKSHRARRRRTGLLVLLCWLIVGAAASAANAQACSDFGGVLDGFAGDIPPSQLQIDQNCTLRNYPASNPLRTNFSFFTQPGQNPDRWLIVFDNVVHTGQMACNAVLQHKIWFTNGSSSAIQQGCQNLLIPVEKIDKKNPPGTATAAIGVPFTYRLTLPVLFDSATGTVIDTSGSLNDLHGITLWDDLNATGAVLDYVSHTAYWESTGVPVPHTFSNVGGFLTFDNFPIVPAGEQIIIELQVVLPNTPANAPGTQFFNTAKWDFGRLIDGVFHEPLPGEWGITPPLTIAAPELEMTKSGPATLNLGQPGDFTLDVRNSGTSDAFDTTIVDELPDGPTGGMCDVTPQVTSARVFAADGVTPVPGKGPLAAGTDYALGYSGAPVCELVITMSSAAGVIGPGERLIVTYRTELDANTQNGAQLTNVAGATEWYNGDSSSATRQRFARALTDGTVGTLDHEDAHTVLSALSGFFFEKTVVNLTSGANPAATAAPGDLLRYSLRLRTTATPLVDVTVQDDLGVMNPTPVFVPGSFALVAASVPPGADASNTDPNGGTNGAGLLDVRGIDVPAGGEVLLEFDIQVPAPLADGTLITNQADLIDTVKIADSDDPNINGSADPDVPGDEDPTRLVVVSVPAGPLAKAITQPTAAIGESFSYRITVPETPHPIALYDVVITDDLTASAADLRFLSVSKVAGSGSWVPVNTGTGKDLVLRDTSGGIDIPAGEQVTVEITVVVEDTPTNVAGLSFTNTAGYRYRWIDGDPSSQAPGLPGTSPPMTIVEPDLTMSKTGPATLTVGAVGSFTLDVQNAGGAPAHEVTLVDRLPDGPTGGTCDVAPSAVTARVFASDGTTPVSAPLVENTDFVVGFVGAPTCEMTLQFVTAATTIGPSERLIVGYQTQLDANSQSGAALTNVAGATEWSSGDGSNPATAGDRRTDVRTLTDGTPGVVDHEDALTLVVDLPGYLFEKTVANLTTGANPATTASPGDVLRYRLRLESQSTVPLVNLEIHDEIDRLNASPVFEAGTLQLVTLPAGADASATDPNGGAAGTGLVDVRGLSLAGAGAVAIVEFDVTLVPVIADGTQATNQSELRIAGVRFTDSDDPNVNGPADPLVAGDEDPTQITIQSAPVFQVQKVSADLTGSPTVLLAGETLRYTLTVRNIGNADAVDAALRDAVPANTTYVPGSTRLNGAAVADGPGGSSPLVAGIPIQDASAATPGEIRADPAGTAGFVATVEFDVVVDAGVVDGTVISNQGFVSAPSGNVFDQPSDDPGTAIPDDPTRDVVGAVPLLFAPKRVRLEVDQGSPGIVDPGDVLRYTIEVHNSGGVAATGVVLTDAVPANTTYVADTTTLNGLPVGRPDGGSAPLQAGFAISSSDLTPPLPGPGLGTLSPGERAVVEFDLQVNAGVPGGTVISNQATVTAGALPALLTDGDGDPSTGPEPTQVVVGSGQQLAITKTVLVVGGGPVLAGSVLEYRVRVANIAAVAAQAVVITDDLDVPLPGQLALVPGSARLDGGVAGISVVGSVITADYAATAGALAPGAATTLVFQATVAPGLATGTTVTNVAEVRWNTPTQTATASVSVDVGGTPGSGTLSGSVWHDADFDDAIGGAERRLGGWLVELLRNGQRVDAVTTDAQGTYRIAGLAPNDTGSDRYALRFRAPGAGVRTAALGVANSPFTDTLQAIDDIVVASGANLIGLDLPIDPNGTIYGALTRAPVGGAALTLLGASGQPLPAGCFDDPVQQGQVTRADGFYKFDLNFSDAACPSGTTYRIRVAPPGAGFASGVSQLIPPQAPVGGSFPVPACPGTAADAIPATPQHCEVQPSELPPPPSAAPQSAGTAYYLALTFDASAPPGSSQVFNNHVPVDPVLGGALAITKTTPAVNVSRGQLVPYEIVLRNDLATPLPALAIVDRFPTGFRYVEGSARVDGVPTEPRRTPGELTWDDLTVPAGGERTVVLLLAVGAGVREGEYVNRAQAIEPVSGIAFSGEATATVRVVPDPTFDCTDVTGKVFADRNRNGRQDDGERGLPGVRIMTVRGLAVITDAHGRYHVTCAATPREGRGSNFALKLDDRTLPTGYRLSTPQVKVQRATRGKALRLNFAASIHRVVGLDMADAVFVPGSTEMRRQWRPRVDLLLEELQKSPSTLRLSYIADLEAPELVERRMEAVKAEIARAWERAACCDALQVESEVFWRRGGPVAPPAALGEERR